MIEELREVNSKEWYNKKSSLLDKERLFDKRIWRVTDVASFLECSVGHIYNLVSEERIPNRKCGKFLVFLPQEVYEWVLRKKRYAKS